MNHELIAMLRDLEQWLSSKDWGTYDYMEGTDVYDDIEKHLDTVRSALARLSDSAKDDTNPRVKVSPSEDM